VYTKKDFKTPLFMRSVVSDVNHLALMYADVLIGWGRILEPSTCDTSRSSLEEIGYYFMGKAQVWLEEVHPKLRKYCNVLDYAPDVDRSSQIVETDIYTRRVDDKYPGMLAVYQVIPKYGLYMVRAPEREPWPTGTPISKPSNRNLKNWICATETMAELKKPLDPQTKVSSSYGEYRLLAAVRSLQNTPQLVNWIYMTLFILGVNGADGAQVCYGIKPGDICVDDSEEYSYNSYYKMGVRWIRQRPDFLFCLALLLGIVVSISLMLIVLRNFKLCRRLTGVPAWAIGIPALPVEKIDVRHYINTNIAILKHVNTTDPKVLLGNDGNFQIEYTVPQLLRNERDPNKPYVDFSLRKTKQIIFVGKPKLESIISTSEPTPVQRNVERMTEICYKMPLQDLKTPVESVSYKWMHAGWAVNVAQGLAMTASHVITDVLEAGYLPYINVFDPSTKKRIYQCTSEVSRYKNEDLMLISTTLGLRTARLHEPRTGDNVTLLGASGLVVYESSLALDNLLTSTSGLVLELPTDTNVIIHAASSQKGNSGSPIWRGSVCVGTHQQIYCEGVSNKGVRVSNDIIQWVREVALDVRKRLNNPNNESGEMTFGDWCNRHTIGVDEVAQDSQDPQLFRVRKIDPNTKQWVTYIIDATLVNNIDVYQEDPQGRWVTVSRRTLQAPNERTGGKSSRGAKGKLLDRNRAVKKGASARGDKVKNRNSKSSRRALHHIVKRHMQHAQVMAADPEFGKECEIDSDEEFSEEDCSEEDDTLTPHIPGAEVVARVKWRHISDIDKMADGSAIDTGLIISEFGVSEEEYKEFVPPTLTRQAELLAAQWISKRGQDTPEISQGLIEAHLRYAEYTHGILPTQYQGALSDWKTVADVILVETWDSTPGYRFMECAPGCNGIHMQKKDVFSCVPCCAWLFATCEDVWNGKVDGTDPVLSVFLKEEDTTQKKKDEGRQRLIFGGDLVLEMVQRRTHHTSYKWWERNAHTHNPMILGFNMLKGGHNSIAIKMNPGKCGRCAEVDVSSMDLSASGQLIGIAYDTWLSVMKIPVTQATRYERQFLVGHKLMRIGDHLELVGSDSRPRLGLNPSGHFLTTIINSYISHFVVFLASIRLSTREVDFKNEEHLMDLARDLTSVLHGDDAIFSYKRPIDDGAFKSSIILAYEAVGLTCKKVITDESGGKDMSGKTFLGFLFKKSDTGWLISMAQPARVLRRLKNPLRSKKLKPDMLAQILNGVSIISINDHKFSEALEAYALKKNVSLLPRNYRRQILTGLESNSEPSDISAILYGDDDGLLTAAFTQRTGGTSGSKPVGSGKSSVSSSSGPCSTTKCDDRSTNTAQTGEQGSQSSQVPRGTNIGGTPQADGKHSGNPEGRKRDAEVKAAPATTTGGGQAEAVKPRPTESKAEIKSSVTTEQNATANASKAKAKTKNKKQAKKYKAKEPAKEAKLSGGQGEQRVSY